MQSPVVSVEWLFENRHNPELIILDASLQKPVADPLLQKDTAKIPGSIFFDIENVFSDKQHPLPHMMPSAETFTHEAQLLGINQQSIIVVYDNIGVYAAPRAWWMFRAMGHEQVYVLNGGLPQWKKAGFSCSEAYAQPLKKGDFIASYQPSLITAQPAVAAALLSNDIIVVDARSPERFVGKAPEPRKGLKGGHMPNAVNIYFEQLLNGNILKEKPALEDIFNAVADREQLIIFSCGSGITACITALGAAIAGYKHLSVYDGSWCEWGSLPGTPVIS
ncbi:sulfurtransferase [Ferruginibacter sp.]